MSAWEIARSKKMGQTGVRPQTETQKLENFSLNGKESLMSGKNRRFTAEFRIAWAQRIGKGKSISALSQELSIRRCLHFREKSEADRHENQQAKAHNKVLLWVQMSPQSKTFQTAVNKLGGGLTDSGDRAAMCAQLTEERLCVSSPRS
jgi:transposase-like protein